MISIEQLSVYSRIF